MMRDSKLRWAGVLLLVCLLLVPLSAVDAQPPAPTATPVEATIRVERAPVFPSPDRNATPLTYLFEAERAPVLGRSPDGVFLLVAVGDVQGWILSVQAELTGDVALVPIVTGADATSERPPTATITPFQGMTATPDLLATRTPLPTRTPVATLEPIVSGDVSLTATPEDTALPMLPGVPPTLEITLPADWEAAHLVVPLRTFDDNMHDIPLTIYFGPLPGDATAYIYLYWGFPNTVDWVTGEYNLWADGVQLLRGSLIGESCNLGVYDQETFRVGGLEGVGAYYQAADCEGESDTAGWFSTLRVYNGSYAFFVAVEPWQARTAQRDTLQAILDSVIFLPPDEDTPQD